MTVRLEKLRIGKFTAEDATAVEKSSQENLLAAATFKTVHSVFYLSLYHYFPKYDVHMKITADWKIFTTFI
jgi:hypothetical protein